MSVRHPSRRRSVIALLLLAVVVATMAIIIRNSGASQPVVDPTAPPAPSLPAHPTLLVQVRDDGLTNVNNVLIGLDTPTSQASALYLPQDLVVDLVMGADETLGITGFKPIAQAAPLVTAQLGVRVDQVFVMDRLAFAGLVDSVGGIAVDVTEPLIVQDRFGAIVEVIPLGERTLDGPQAALYVSYLGPGEPESARQRRFEDVWEKTLAGLPANPDQIRAVLASLGALSRSTGTLAGLAEFLTEAGADARSGSLTRADLPTRSGGLGPLPLEWVDPVPAEVTVAGLFPEALPRAAAPPVRVRVYQAGPTQSAAGTVREQLQNAGFSFVWSGTVAPQSATQVAVADESLLAVGRTVAETVGAAATAVTVDPGATPGAPVTVRYVVDLPATATSVSPVVAPTASS